MLMVCKNKWPPVITIFHFSPRGFLEKKSLRGFFKASILGSKIKLRFTLAICLTHLSMFQVYINIFIFPAGIFPHGDFFCTVFIFRGFKSMAKYFFCIYSHLYCIYIVYGMDPAQLLHVVVKQAGKLYLRFTWSQTQRQFFTLCCPYTCIHSKAAPVRATCLFHLFIHFAKS